MSQLGSGISGCSPERRGEVPREMDMLHEQTDRARHLLDALVSKLTPVTRCAEPAKQQNGCYETTGTGLGGSIQNARLKLSSALDDLADLLGLIEL